MNGSWQYLSLTPGTNSYQHRRLRSGLGCRRPRWTTQQLLIPDFLISFLLYNIRTGNAKKCRNWKRLLVYNPHRQRYGTSRISSLARQGKRRSHLRLLHRTSMGACYYDCSMNDGGITHGSVDLVHLLLYVSVSSTCPPSTERVPQVISSSYVATLRFFHLCGRPYHTNSSLS